MAMIIQGDANAFNALVYGVDRRPSTVAYLQNQMAAFSTGSLTEFGKQFVTTAQQVYDSFNSSEAVRAAKAAIRRFDAMYLPDHIQYIEKLNHLQNAPVTMQRWIMAQPDLRKLYHEQRVDGYSDTYVDLYWGRTDFEHYDWRLVHNGVMEEVTTDELDGHITRHWLAEDIVPGDRELTMDEKTDILNTHDVIKAYVEMGVYDPTSKANNKM
jgi:hypothetical protein